MVLVATAAQIVKSGLLDPSAVFLPSVATIFIITGLLHPNEMLNLLHGFLYLVTIPGGYLLLVTYALCNLHVVSWGTRETVEVVRTKNPNQVSGKEMVQASKWRSFESDNTGQISILQIRRNVEERRRWARCSGATDKMDKNVASFIR